MLVNKLLIAILHEDYHKIKLLHKKDETLIFSKHKIIENHGVHFFDTVLNFASRRSSKETVRFLIDEFKLDVRETGHKERNCFFAAIEGGKIDLLKYLHSVNETLVNATDDDGSTALIFASAVGSKESVQWLIEKTKVNHHGTDFNGMNCVFAAIRCGFFWLFLGYFEYILSKLSDFDQNRPNHLKSAI